MKVIRIFTLATLLACFIGLPSVVQSTSGKEGRPADEKPTPRRPGQRHAKIKSKPSPGYPAEARMYKAQAVVRLRLVLAASGEVTNIEVVRVSVSEGAPKEVADAFAREAVKAAERIEFEPATDEGKPSSRYVLVEYGFNPY